MIGSLKPPHHRARAKACIFLYLEGGPSHIDTFDPKPKLADLHMKEFARNDKLASAMANGKRYFIQSPFKFRQAGKFSRRSPQSAGDGEAAPAPDHAERPARKVVLLECQGPEPETEKSSHGCHLN